MRSRLNLTSSAVSGVPSWNVTPDRSVKVYVSESEDTVHLVATCGTRPGFGPLANCTSVSYMARSTSSTLELLAPTGSSEGGALAVATDRVPCGVVVADPLASVSPGLMGLVQATADTTDTAAASRHHRSRRVR